MSDGAEEAWHLSLRMSSAQKCLLASVAMKAGFRSQLLHLQLTNASKQGKSNANTQMRVTDYVLRMPEAKMQRDADQRSLAKIRRPRALKAKFRNEIVMLPAKAIGDDPRTASHQGK